MASLTHRIANTGTLLTNTNFDENSQFGSGSLQFNGTSSTLSGTSNIFNFGTGDFTVEYWIYPTSFAINPSIIDSGTSSLSTTRYSDYISSFGIFNLYFGAITYTCPTPITSNAWTHIAATRSGTSLKVFTNGIQNGSTVVNSTNISDNVQYLIGGYVTASNYLTGYMSNIRIVKGTAVYTANFAPPQIALTNIANTSLLLPTYNYNSFQDYSSNNNIITNTGVTANTLSPFSKSSRYTANNIVGIMDEVTKPVGLKLRMSNTGTILINGQFDEVSGVI